MNFCIRCVFLMLIICASPAQAYIGPGMGGGAIVAVLGIIGAVFLGLFGLIYFPVKRAIKKRGKKNTAESESEEDLQDGEKKTNKIESTDTSLSNSSDTPS